MTPVFLSLSEVLEIHQDQIGRYGGLTGIRDLDLLKSALGMPSATYGGEFLHADLFEMASAYLFHLVKNHPFVDGNKRTGTVAALVFMELNDLAFRAPEEDLVAAVLNVPNSAMDKAALALFLRKWTER